MSDYRIAVPVPSVSVEYRLTAMQDHSSTRPPGQTTRTFTELRSSRTKTDQHPRIVGRRVAAVGTCASPQRHGRCLADDPDARAERIATS